MGATGKLVGSSFTEYVGIMFDELSQGRVGIGSVSGLLCNTLYELKGYIRDYLGEFYGGHSGGGY